MDHSGFTSPVLREFVFNSRHPDPRRACWGGSEQRLLTPDPADPADCSGSAGSADEFQIVYFPYVFTAKMARLTLRCNVFFTCSYPSHLKHLVLRAVLEDGLPEMLSKLGALAERGIKKSKNITR